MRFIKPANGVIFAEDELEKAFVSLADNSPLKNSINQAIRDLKENIFCGEQIKKARIPKEYIKNIK
jgi:hypothetical protein